MRTRLLGLLAVLPLAACGATAGPDLGLDPRAERLDQQQYEQLRAAVDRVADDAFAAAGTAVDGRVRAYQLVTVRCAARPRTVGSLTVVGELTYAEPDDTVTDRAIDAAWRDLGLERDAQGRAGAFARTDLPEDLPGELQADVGARASRDEPGSRQRVRQLFASSPCVDLRDVEVPDEDRGDLDDQLR
ncbi:hypothetical protein [Nocardioides aurantiacus]|uniref:Lipoprotein n=1 Tax=Nocardioides aurantiacus TaxID=86796 RepID=A0A3N2CWP6_9ACTN|nr:hypothetical protein [Nocardioides aurantiacus]ROR91614.1 hypothetical protein EDD33_2484 [Nocardioides aurantiacus]